MFGALKVIGKDNRQTLEAFRPKYVFFTYIGDKVSVLQRAKVSVQRGAAEKIFNVTRDRHTAHSAQHTAHQHTASPPADVCCHGGL
jgi:2-hydroxy-3-keto-5-methylthiopentenyl-1-phosphate phosphatase